MPNNNSSKNSSKMSMSFGKGKNSMAMLFLIVIIACVAIAYYFIYKSNHENFSGQSKLTPASGECIVALFYAPWCGHCKTFKPEFENAMNTLDGKVSKHPKLSGKTVRFSMLDCDDEENKPLATKYGVSGYPTVKIFKDDGGNIEYDGGRTLAGISKFLDIDN